PLPFMGEGWGEGEAIGSVQAVTRSPDAIRDSWQLRSRIAPGLGSDGNRLAVMGSRSSRQYLAAWQEATEAWLLAQFVRELAATPVGDAAVDQGGVHRGVVALDHTLQTEHFHGRF